MGLAAETVLFHLTQLSQPPWLLCRRVRTRVLPRLPMSLLPPGGALQRGPPRRLRLPLCIAVGSSFLSTVTWGLPSLFSLSLPGSAPTCRVGTSLPRLPPPFSALNCIDAPCCDSRPLSPCPRSQVRVSNRSGGPGPPSVFCFLSFKTPARPPPRGGSDPHSPRRADQKRGSAAPRPPSL